METLFQQHAGVAFAIAFVCLWLVITSVFGFATGWYQLMGVYPDTQEQASLKLNWQSGWMGPLLANMSGILTFGVCPSGLRVGVWRLFGPFCRDFFVPWSEIRAKRGTMFFVRTVTLEFGSPVVGNLGMRAQVANRLARAAGTNWPEKRTFSRESDSQIFMSLFKEWALLTTFAALFFTVAPVLMGGVRSWPGPLVAIAFPAVVFGVTSVVRYAKRRSE